MKRKIYRDPVCGEKINRQRAKKLIKYKGYGYYICCPLCQSEFEQNPDKYTKPEYAFKLSKEKRERGRQIK